MADEFCKPDSYLAICGAYTAPNDCRAEVKLATYACAARFPELLAELSEENGRKFGLCVVASAIVKLTHEGRLTSEGKCGDPDQFQ